MTPNIYFMAYLSHFFRGSSFKIHGVKGLFHFCQILSGGEVGPQLDPLGVNFFIQFYFTTLLIYDN